MRNLTIAIIVTAFALGACSSKKKEDIPPAIKNNTSTPMPMPMPGQDQDSGVDMEKGFPDVEGTERSGANCTYNGDQRVVSVIDTPESTCGVVYTKFGVKKTVAYARYEMDFCDKVFDNILGNLTAGGFDCNSSGNESSEEESQEAEQGNSSQSSSQEEASSEQKEPSDQGQ